MINPDVVIDNLLWKKKIKQPKVYIKKRLIKLNRLNLFKKKSKNCTIFLTNNKKMMFFNKKFRNKNKSTDVLSFPFKKNFNYKKNNYLGDIAISYEIVNKRSKKTNFFIEFDKMWIHGYLHLLGYDHKKKKDYIKMNQIEELILNYFYK